MTTTISGSNGIVFPDATSMQTGQQAVKAWVNFDGTGTVSIRAGYNVASITDNGTGNYAVNFTTAMPDANYAVAATSQSTTSIAPLVTWSPRVSGLAGSGFNVSGVPENSTGGGTPDVVEMRCAVFN